MAATAKGAHFAGSALGLEMDRVLLGDRHAAILLQGGWFVEIYGAPVEIYEERRVAAHVQSVGDHREIARVGIHVTVCRDTQSLRRGIVTADDVNITIVL